MVNNGSGRGSKTSKAADLEGKMGSVILPYLGYRFKGFERREQKGFEAKKKQARARMPVARWTQC